VKRGRFSAPLHQTHPGTGEEVAGAAPSDVPGQEGSTGTLSPQRDFSGEKQSRFLRTCQCFQPCRSISGQLGAVAGRVGHQPGTLSPGMTVTFSVPSSTDRSYGMNHTQGLGAPHAAQAPTRPEKHILATFFKRDSFLLKVCVVGGHLSAAVAQDRALGRKQSKAGSHRAGAVTCLALPPAPRPQILQELPLLPPSPTESEISLQPALLTRCWAEASAAPDRLQLARHGGDSAPKAPPASGP